MSESSESPPQNAPLPVLVGEKPPLLSEKWVQWTAGGVAFYFVQKYIVLSPVIFDWSSWTYLLPFVRCLGIGVTLLLLFVGLAFGWKRMRQDGGLIPLLFPLSMLLTVAVMLVQQAMNQLKF